MSKLTRTLQGLGLVLVVVVPIALSLHLAHRYAMSRELADADSLAGHILQRAEALGEQMSAAHGRFAGMGRGLECTRDVLAQMHALLAGSQFIRAVGMESNGQVACSTLGPLGEGASLGPVDYVSRFDVEFRRTVRLSPELDQTFLVVAKDGFFVVVHAETLHNLLGDRTGTSTAIVSATSGEPLVTAGDFDADWSDKARSRSTRRFFDGQHLVVTHESSRFDVATLVAVPVDTLRAQVWRLGLLLLPIGLALGVAMALVARWMILRRGSLPSVLRAALKRDEFEVLYQPIVDLASGELAGAEALLRWSPEKGVGLLPSTFIPIAEQSGLMGTFTHYVLGRVAKDAPRLVARFPHAYISMNLSPMDLHEEEVVRHVLDLPRKTGLAPVHFLVEVTELAFVDHEHARRCLERIRASGIRVAIDDFGTGYSGLSRLAEIGSDCLKIDRAFVESIGTDSPSREVALQIVGMAKALGLAIIGEGIETSEQAEFLHRHGVRFGQGWFYGRAQRLDHLLAWGRLASPVPGRATSK